MLKSLSIPQIFSVPKKQERSIQSIKSQLRPRHAYAAVQPFWGYASYGLIALNILVLFSYLLGVNATASTGYEIKKIQQKIDYYSEETKKMNLKLSEQTSIASIQSDYTRQGFVPVSGAKYLQLNSFSEAGSTYLHQ